MNKYITALILFFLFYNALAQDVIYKRNGDKINVKVIEITLDAVKYRSFDDINGPLRSISIRDIYMIRYENGKEEFFKVVEDSAPKEYFFSRGKNKYLSLAAGFGTSYGGFGIRFQGRVGGLQGLGYHSGIGYFPAINSLSEATWYSVGLKFFYYKAWYFNVQYGSVTQFKLYNHPDEFTIFGPSVLIGGDWFFNDYIGMNGAIGVSYPITYSEYDGNRYLPTLDIGFVFKF